MKKFLRLKYLPLYTLICSAIGFGLRLWTLGGGPDAQGLYEPQPLAWTLLWIVTILCFCLIGLIARPLKVPQHHFPASLPAAVGNGFAAAGMILAGFRASGNPSTIYSLVMSLVAIAAALGLCLAAAARYRGNRQPYWAYLLACLFLCLRLFDRCRGWSEVSQTGVYLFPFLASACLVMAFYHITALQVDMGNRRSSLLFSLFGTYLCIVSLAHSEDLLFYLCMIVFLLTNLCSLRLPKKHKPEATTPIEPPASDTEPEDPPKPAPTEMSYEELMDWLKNG